MNRFFLCIFLSSLLHLPVHGEKKDVFHDSIMVAYNDAFVLNEKKDYFNAYTAILKAEGAINETLRAHGMKAPDLNDFEFQRIFWPIKKSKAEIAYMLGLHTDMECVVQELKTTIQNWRWEAEDDEKKQSVINALRADLNKIEGNRYYLIENYDSAETCLRRAISLSPEFGNDWFVCKVRDDLAQLYYKQEHYGMALSQLDSILTNPLYSDDFSRKKETKANILLIKSQRALCLARLGKYDEAVRIIDPILSVYKKQRDKRLYAETLRKKAKILMLQCDATGIYNPLAKKCYVEYLFVSKDYIDEHFIRMNESEREQYWMAEQPFVTDCFRLGEKAPELLYDVALYSKAVLLQMGREFKDGMTLQERKKTLSDIRVSWQQIQKKLPKKGCAIEFIIYEKKGKELIGALVVSPQKASPQFVEIASTETIWNHVVERGDTVRTILLNTENEAGINALYNDSTLRHLIWSEEMITAIGDCDEIFFSPDGIFFQIGIEYLLPESLSKKEFYRLTTTRILAQKRTPTRTDKILMCGDVEYGRSISDQEEGNDELAYAILSKMDFNLPSLSGSAIELDSITAIRRRHSQDHVLRADSVTEGTLKKLLNKYNVLHISTHGLFSEAAKMGTDIRPSSTDTQLSSSCLFLSGSERNLRTPDYRSECHDGVLSAREVAKMELSNVNLAVMSACMSGLGYITRDGIYGLQRGMKTAGVKAIISSLWSVNDKATCFFMTEFYRNLEMGQELHEAFHHAREKMMKHEVTYGGSANDDGDASGSFMQRRRFTIQTYNKPYCYNAFILIDGI